MTADPIIAEIRDWRDKHAARMNYDVNAIFQDIRKMQKASTQEFVTYPPRLASTPVRDRATFAAAKRPRRTPKKTAAMDHMTKVGAIEIVNSHLQHDVLDRTNTHFSNVNSQKEVWWFGIPPEKFNYDLHLLCANKTFLTWLMIEAHSVPHPEKTFRLRQYGGLIDLEISCDPGQYMRDVRSGGSGYDFRPHIRREWP